jgi:endoglucanase
MTEQLHWGSNMEVANHGMVLCLAHRLTGEERFLLAAQKQLHYLLGVNPVSYCYVSGFGAQPMSHPHHRPSVAQGIAQPGMLSGGPCSGLADACAKERLEGQPAGKCFVDDHASYSTNEICIYWNSPLVALTAALSE